jgi:hypothetical protein
MEITVRSTGCALALTALALLLLAPAASADVGVEQVIPPAASPGDSVLVQLGCGFCFPPCVGPRGERRPKGYAHGPCMLGVKADPPRGFPISLIPADGKRSSFHLLGTAVPPPQGNDPASGKPPRYLLRFRVPRLEPGPYTFVVHCAVCNRGWGGSLVRSGRLLVRSPEPRQASGLRLAWTWLRALLAVLTV